MKIGRILGVVVVLLAIGLCGLVSADNPVENVAVLNAMPVILVDPAQAWDWYDMQAMYNLYSPLLYPNPEGGVRAHIALSWEPVDGKLNHWLFKLRPGVKFHDNTELTAEDVAWSMNRIMAMGGGTVMGDVSATAVGADTVEFVLAQPNSVFPATLTQFFILNKDLVLENIKPGEYGDYGDYGNDWLQTHDAGSGPYIMTGHTANVSLDAVRFEDYFLGWEDPRWGPDEVPIERLIFKMESQFSTLMLLLKSGDLDLECDGGWSLPQLREIADTEYLRLNYVWSEDYTVFINAKREPTDDEHFRKAIRHAYDYEAVMEPYLPFGAREGGIYLSSLPGYVPVEPQPRKQDLEKARAELALSKYADKLDEVTVVAHFCAGLTAEEDVYLQLQADMAELGVKVEIAGPPWSQYGTEVATPEDTPNLTIWCFASQYPDPDFWMYGMYHGPNWIYSAHWYFDDPEIIRLLEETRTIVDLADRVPIYEQLQPMIASHALAFYSYERQFALPSQAYLIGPLETFEMVGPNVCMHNWRINLSMKEELRG